MRATNVPLPQALKVCVEEQAAPCGYHGTASEPVRELIQKDPDRLHFRSVLLEGAASLPAEPADAAYFEALRAGVRGARSELRVKRVIIPRALDRGANKA